MRKKCLSGFILLLFWCLSHSAWAALNIELTQGVNAPLPIAVMPFSGGEKVKANQQTLSTIVGHDLAYSGQFGVFDNSQLKTYPSTLSQVNFSYWQKHKINDVVVGTFKRQSGGTYRVSFQLVGIYAQSLAAAKRNPANSVLLAQEFVVNRQQLRSLAHRISDLVYQKLTGVRGVFSTQIAYVLIQRKSGKATQYNLYIADADGYRARRLLRSQQPIMSPTWSPNGKDIAYVSFEHNRSGIYIQNVATGKRWLVSDRPGINGAPAFSPDGKQLALVLTLTGNPKIYSLNLATNKLQQLTHGRSIDTEPYWSRDGKTLLFTSNRGGSPQIYRYNFKTHKVGRLTFVGNYNARASLLPNGQSIVIMHRDQGMFSIALDNLDSGQMQILTRGSLDESPSLAPNGKMVLYATQYGGQGVLAMVSTNGRVKLRLPSTDGSVQGPAWSPFLS